MGKRQKDSRKKKLASTRAIEKENRLESPGHKSNYARKMAFLRTQIRHGRSGWALDYPTRPWK